MMLHRDRWMEMSQKTRGVLLLAIKNSLQYRAAFFTATVGIAFSIVVQMLFWLGVFQLNDFKTLVGYSQTEMLSYILLAQIVNRFIHAADTLWSYATDIRMGKLNMYLLRPVSYYLYRLGMLVGVRLVDLVASFVPIAVAVYLFKNLIQVSLMGLIWSIPVLMGVFFLYFSIDSFIGTMAFWLERVSSLAYLKWLIFGFFAGRLFPINLLPDWVERVLTYLPFPYMVYYPVKIISGQILEPTLILKMIMIIFLWSGFFTILGRLAWQAGLKRYVAIGG